MWDYLSTFWDRIVSVGETTIEWFQQIGHAVAGAIGQLIEFPIRIFTDALALIGYVFSLLIEIFGLAFRPITYFFALIVEIVKSAFVAPDMTAFDEIGGIGANIFSYWQQFVAAAPILGVLGAVVGAGFTFLIGLSIVKTIQKI